jgi:dihydroneopterin aldolase
MHIMVAYPEETKIGGEYIVDVYMVYDFNEAAVKDDLNFNY